MIKIFLVEDEVVIRNGIKKSIQWEKEGYEFVGEASDGELAYPLILKEKPDILITDIKMPFMDGLELSDAIKKELPDIKIIILSGYNDFDYAKKAIGIGVIDYLLKPISADKLLKAIGDVAIIIRKEWEDQELLRKYEADMQENTEQEKQEFLTRILTQPMSMTEMLDQGRHLGMDLSAQVYNMVLFKLNDNNMAEDMRQCLLEAFGCLEQFFEEFSGIYYFRRGVEGWALLCLAENDEDMERIIASLKMQLKNILSPYPEIEYFGGVGVPVFRLRELRESFREADRAFAGRFTIEKNQIISFKELYEEREEELEVKRLGTIEENREILGKFLRNGSIEESESFVSAYFEGISENVLSSAMMCQYILMDIYISIVAFGDAINAEEEEVMRECGELKDIKDYVGNVERIQKYIEKMVRGMLRIRDEVSGRRYSDIIRAAKDHIAENYMSEEISLNSVSASVNMSPSYFSSIFKQEAGKTFVEYLTEVRMEKAKELLMCSSKKTAEIGYEVGYKDSHYFSYIFKKTLGCTTKEYRTRRKS